MTRSRPSAKARSGLKAPSSGSGSDNRPSTLSNFDEFALRSAPLESLVETMSMMHMDPIVTDGVRTHLGLLTEVRRLTALAQLSVVDRREKAIAAIGAAYHDSQRLANVVSDHAYVFNPPVRSAPLTVFQPVISSSALRSKAFNAHSMWPGWLHRTSGVYGPFMTQSNSDSLQNIPNSVSGPFVDAFGFNDKMAAWAAGAEDLDDWMEARRRIYDIAMQIDAYGASSSHLRGIGVMLTRHPACRSCRGLVPPHT